MKKLLFLPLFLYLCFLPACATLTSIYPYVETTAKIVWTIYQNSPEVQDLINRWFDIGSFASDGTPSSIPSEYSSYEEWYASLSKEEKESLDLLIKIIQNEYPVSYSVACPQ